MLANTSGARFMRKVKKADEIKIKNIPANVERFKNGSASKKSIEEFKKLDRQLQNLTRTEGGIDPMTFMEKVYAFVDSYMDRDVYKFTECAKGCAYCCRLYTSVSGLEAAYMLEKTKHLKDITFTRIDSEAQATQNENDDYCPFLNTSTGTCRAYSSRPLNCRVFASIDGWKECVDLNNSHNMHSWSSNEMLAHIRDNINEITASSGLIVEADIRDWFSKK